MNEMITTKVMVFTSEGKKLLEYNTPGRPVIENEVFVWQFPEQLKEEKQRKAFKEAMKVLNLFR